MIREEFKATVTATVLPAVTTPAQYLGGD